MRKNSVSVPGPPRSKARPRFNTKQGRAYTPPASRAAEDELAIYFALKLLQQGSTEVAVHIEFFFSTRRSGDLDNCAKLVLDALVKARVIDDDRQVRALYVTSRDVEKGLEQTIVSLSAEASKG